MNVLANTCGNYNLQSPTFGYYPKPKPNAKNNKVFDNFIMNHLYNNTNMQKKNSSSWEYNNFGKVLISLYNLYICNRFISVEFSFFYFKIIDTPIFS